MIIEYHRPIHLEDAINLLSRKNPKTIPLGGGSGISQGSEGDLAVVDLQSLGLNELERDGNTLKIGAAACLQSLVSWNELPSKMRQTIERESTLNQRNTASLGGSIVRATGKSGLVAMLLALDSRLMWEPGKAEISMGDWLVLKGKLSNLKLMVSCQFTIPVKIQYEYVSRTPADYPIVCASMAQWLSGRTRLVISGAGTMPECVFDGVEITGIMEATKNAHSQYINKYTNPDYQKELLKILVNRMIEQE